MMPRWRHPRDQAADIPPTASLENTLSNVNALAPATCDDALPAHAIPRIAACPGARLQPHGTLM